MNRDVIVLVVAVTVTNINFGDIYPTPALDVVLCLGSLPDEAKGQKESHT